MFSTVASMCVSMLYWPVGLKILVTRSDQNTRMSTWRNLWHIVHGQGWRKDVKMGCQGSEVFNALG